MNPIDGVAILFWVISIMMVAVTVFFLMESMAVGSHKKRSKNRGALVTLVAGGALPLHARVLGPDPRLPHPLPVH